MTLTRVGATDRTRAERDEAAIAAGWDRLAALLEDGTITDGQFAWVVRNAPDDDAHPLVRSMFAASLRRWLADPKAISANFEAFRTYRCSGGCRDEGWVETPAPELGPNRYWRKPCRECNPRGYALWRDHWSDPNHSCPECHGRGRRAPADAIADDRDQRRLEDLEELA